MGRFFNVGKQAVTALKAFMDETLPKKNDGSVSVDKLVSSYGVDNALTLLKLKERLDTEEVEE